MNVHMNKFCNEIRGKNKAGHTDENETCTQAIAREEDKQAKSDGLFFFIFLLDMREMMMMNW